MMQGIGSTAGAVSLLIAAKIGAASFGSWRLQKLTERKMMEAERVLSVAYRTRRELKFVRNPFILGHELFAAEERLKTDGLWDGQTEARRKRLKTAQAFYTRIAGAKAIREEIDNCLPMARALFGAPVEKALEELNRKFWLVQVDVESYINDDGSNQDFSKQIRLGMYDVAAPDEVNETSQAIEQHVATIETACLPLLTLEA